jgi:ABC-type branched-subunit amino acid transport system substrate-binding protein
MPADATGLTRRRLLRTLLARALLPLAALPAAGCGDTLRGAARGGAGAGGRSAALLLPLSGEAAAIGENMARAAALVTLAAGDGGSPRIHDSGDSPEAAAAAARRALAEGARLLFGPLRAEQTPAVLAEAGRVPVVTFSNDDRLAAQGAFVMGITPAQSLAAVFTYARTRRVGSVALVARDTAFGAAAAAAAGPLAAAAGLRLAGTLLRAPEAPGLLDALRAAGGGTLPDAVVLPDGGAALEGFARALRGGGLQLLGSVQWGAGEVAANPDLAGAWFAAPPPDLFQPFAERFAAAHGAPPGVVAALGHDAALVAIGLAAARAASRRGLTRAGGFTGVLGPFRFRADGRCLRDLAVLTLEGGSFALLAEVTGS